MLVLSRQRDQAIIIGDDIEVSVVDLRGDKVRLGINAPRSVSVHRKEIYEAIRKENQAAAQINPQDVSSLVSSPQNSTMRLVTEDAATDQSLMRAALDEAKKSLSHGGMPIGAVLVRAGRIIGHGHDRRLQRGDRMSLAELDCLSNAGPQKTYKDTALYITLMPGLLACGAVIQCGVSKVIVGDTVNTLETKCKASDPSQLLRDCGVEVVDLHDAECIEMMAKFKQENPGRSDDTASE